MYKNIVSQIIYHSESPVWKRLKINSFQSHFIFKNKQENFSFQIILLLINWFLLVPNTSNEFCPCTGHSAPSGTPLLTFVLRA